MCTFVFHCSLKNCVHSCSFRYKNIKQDCGCEVRGDKLVQDRGTLSIVGSGAGLGWDAPALGCKEVTEQAAES